MFERRCDQTGEISIQHGRTLIRTLRKRYGGNFARGCADDEELRYVLHKLDERSLGKLIRDHQARTLEKACSA
jgi:hypothetical protein